MNYYEHHIGDYAEATAHLTFIEDAAYTRMIRKYYAQEKPLPAEVKSIQRLVGARTKEEREAVETILGEFFQLQDDGWHNGRCDAELARYLEKTDGKQAKRDAEKERQRKHRERRKELFEALRERGIVPSFDATTEELVTLLSRPMSQPVTEPVTRDATATQSPVTSHQSPNTSKPFEAAAQASTEVGAPDDERLPPRPQHTGIDPGMRAVAIATLLTGAGVKKVTAFHPDVAVTWAQDDRVTDVLLLAAVKRAKETLGEEPFQVAYLRPIVVELLNPPEPKAAKPKTDDWAWKRSNQGIEAKGRELNMFARGGESYPDFAARIQAAIDKRKGA